MNCGFAAALLAHVGLGCIPLLRFGTEAQKHEVLVPALRGEKLGSFGLSEPNAGSDAASLRTTADRRGDEYVINGSKMFITNGNIADYCLVAAYTDRSKRGAGISMFVVDTKSPGFHVSRKLRKTGHHTSETAALTFEDLRVPVSALLGGVEGGFKQVTGTLEGGRITHAARSVGVSQAAFDAALAYAQEREQFGRKIAEFQAIKFKLARMATEVEMARTATRGAPPGCSIRVHACARRPWRSSSPPRSRNGSPGRRCRSTAATATSPSSRSSATGGMRA